MQAPKHTPSQHAERPARHAQAGADRRVSGHTARPNAASASRQRPPQHRARPTGTAHRTTPPRHASGRSGAPVRRTGARRRRYRVDRRRLMLLGAALLAVIAIVAIILAIVPSSHAPVEAQPDATEAASAATQAPQSTLMAQPEPTAQAPLPTMVAEYTILEDKLTTDHALGLPESPRVDDSYFNDCLFVGDSVSEKLRLFVSQERKENPTYLGNARFITASSFSARNALREVTETSLHPSWQGQKMRLEDLIPLTGATKVYIMLGMNDAGISGYKDAAQNLMTLIGLIQEKSPDIQIFIETATPRLSGTHPTTKQLLAFNLQVNEYVQQLGDPNVNIVDVAFVMRDEEGKLKAEYCSDPDNMAIHFTNAGCRAWVDYLYTHALVAS